MSEPWFKNKRYGWGWYPANGKGWAVIGLWLVGFIAMFSRGDIAMRSTNDALVGSVLPALVLTAILIVVSYVKGEKPEWRWKGEALTSLSEDERVRASALFALPFLFAGTMISWSAVYGAFVRFNDMYGTVFRIRECAVSNPVLMPCFYGAVAFGAAFIASAWVAKSKSSAQLRALEHLLWFGSIFALTVLSYELLQYYGIVGGRSMGCVPSAYPLTSACAIGGVLFVTTALLLKHFRTHGAKG